MKKPSVLFLILFSLTTGSAFGDAPIAPQYKTKESNGLVTTYLDPYYVIDGKEYPLAMLSNEPGSPASLCQRMGSSEVTTELEQRPGFKKTDAAGYDRNGNLVVMQTEYVADMVICSEALTAQPSTYYSDRIENADGTITIVEPRFKFRNDLIFFHEAPGTRGVCKIFGLGAPVEMTVRQSPENPSMQTNVWMYFDGFQMSGTYFQAGLWRGNYSYGRVKSVTCKN